METDTVRPRLLRRVIIDMLPYSVTDTEILQLQDRLGLVPSSLDTLAMERRESTIRIQSLNPISQALTDMSGYSAEAIAEYFLMRFDGGVHDEDDDDDEIPVDYLRSVLVRQHQQVITTAVHAIVSHLVASGILAYTQEYR